MSKVTDPHKSVCQDVFNSMSPFSVGEEEASFQKGFISYQSLYQRTFQRVDSKVEF